MEDDKTLDDIDNEIKNLQQVLKDRLTETMEIKHLDEDILFQTCELEKNTKNLERQSMLKKYKIMFLEFKWYIITLVIFVIMFIFLFFK